MLLRGCGRDKVMETSGQSWCCCPVGAGSVSCSRQQSLPTPELLGQCWGSASKPRGVSHRWGVSSAQAFPPGVLRPMALFHWAGGSPCPPGLSMQDKHRGQGKVFAFPSCSHPLWGPFPSLTTFPCSCFPMAQSVQPRMLQEEESSFVFGNPELQQLCVCSLCLSLILTTADVKINPGCCAQAASGTAQERRGVPSSVWESWAVLINHPDLNEWGWGAVPHCCSQSLCQPRNGSCSPGSLPAASAFQGVL